MQVTGVDILEIAIRVAREKADDNNVTHLTKFVVADVSIM